MKERLFQVNDKVTLKPECTGWVATVPPLVPGRVYCVEKVNILYGNVWLRLVGIREHKYKCADDRGPMALAFQLVGRTGTSAKKGGS